MKNNTTLQVQRSCCNFVIAAPSSGSGKTTITLGLLRALVRKNYTVQPYKTGPDYLDGLLHRIAAGKPSYNLDTWMNSESQVYDHFITTLGDSDFGVVEGVMGLFDGFEGKNAGSTAECAITLKIPVILVVNCKGMAGSVAPLVCGFRDFNKGCSIAGVICNNVGSDLHAKYLNNALATANIRVFGCIPRNEALHQEHRHLGLVAEYTKDIEKKIDLIADTIDQCVDIKAIRTTCSPINRNKIPAKPNCIAIVNATCRIAVAYDNAFNFYYQANLDLLRDNGAELLFFSPLSDVLLPQDIQGLYLGGGYPEEYAEELTKNREMRKAILEFSQRGGCVYAECGGYMYLGSQIVKDSESFPMCGVFKSCFVMAGGKRKMLGYREAILNRETILGIEGTRVRGHEFHYSYCDNPDETSAPFSVLSRSGSDVINTGEYVNNTLGSYMHIHFLSCPSVVESFIAACRRIRNSGLEVQV